MYPAIARAAHISGTVIGRVHFSTTGKVEGFEVVSGPVMLARAVGDQIRSWTLHSDSSGDESCQTLFVASFTVGEEPPITFRNSAGLFAVSVHAEQLILYSTPSLTASR